MSFDRLHGIDRKEQERVKALIRQDAMDRETERMAMLDPDGERRFVKPSDAVRLRRKAAANGMSETETVDTIGKLWCWGMLDGSKRFAADLLRDAGRRYAISYWHRYGQVCARIPGYSDFIGHSQGPRLTVIADPKDDEIAEARFAVRAEALRTMGAKRVVDQFCVDGAGDNDPLWLVALITGFPAETRTDRAEIEALRADAERALGKDMVRAKRKLAGAERALAMKLRILRAELLPHRTIDLARCGLEALAEIDARDGLHRPKRAKTRRPEQ